MRGRGCRGWPPVGKFERKERKRKNMRKLDQPIKGSLEKTRSDDYQKKEVRLYQKMGTGLLTVFRGMEKEQRGGILFLGNNGS